MWIAFTAQHSSVEFKVSQLHPCPFSEIFFSTSYEHIFIKILYSDSVHHKDIGCCSKMPFTLSSVLHSLHVHWLTLIKSDWPLSFEFVRFVKAFQTVRIFYGIRFGLVATGTSRSFFVLLWVQPVHFNSIKLYWYSADNNWNCVKALYRAQSLNS